MEVIMSEYEEDLIECQSEDYDDDEGLDDGIEM